LREYRVGHDKFFIQPCPYFGCPDTHVDDFDNCALYFQNIPGFYGALDQQDNARDKILDNVLHGETDGNGKDGAGGKKGADIDANGLQADTETDNDD